MECLDQTPVTLEQDMRAGVVALLSEGHSSPFGNSHAIDVVERSIDTGNREPAVSSTYASALR